MIKKKSSLVHSSIKIKFLLRSQGFKNFLQLNESTFPKDKYDVLKRLLFELSKFERDLKKISYNDFDEKINLNE
jgi:hypothetical protein